MTRGNLIVIPSLPDENYHCVQKALQSVILNQGISILDNPKKIRALLSDLCPGDHKRKIVLLERLLDEKIHTELLRQKDSLSYEHLSENLTNRILANYPYDKDLVQEGIHDLAVALQIISIKTKIPNRTPQKNNDIGVNLGLEQAIDFNKSNLFHQALDILNTLIKKDPSTSLIYPPRHRIHHHLTP